MPKVASPLGGIKSDLLGENALKLTTNACFGVMVIAVVTLTVIAVTYQPPDPWLQPSRFMTKIFTAVENATYQKDGSILITGEDVPGGIVTGAAAPPAISQSDVQAAEELVLSKVTDGVCDPNSMPINCSDPGVMIAIEKANLDKFPDIESFEYGAPVRGSDETECDIAWKFKPKKENSVRMYKDYRRYKLQLEPSCAYAVLDAGDWHSGKNARPQKFHGIDVNDSVPAQIEADDSFRKRKYLYYSRGGDYCKGMSHFQWSLLCALGEAQYLDRTFVLDLDLCLSAASNPGHEDEKVKDFRFYFDFEHLMEAASVIEQKQFLKEWEDWNSRHSGDQITYKVVSDFKVAPTQLQGEESTILWRTFELPEPDNYWYRVCEGEAEKVIQRPWNVLWKSKRLMNIVNSICGSLGWDFDSLHVVRGQKAQNKELWPNLDADTAPEALLQKLKDKIDEKRNVYIATNELQPGYFEQLNASYKVFVLDDFQYLWAPGSEWYSETTALANGQPVEFDGNMRAEVDSEVFMRGKKHVETFGELTFDCKDGVHTCKSS
ncbi:hypothetical protein O6H91_17G045000 [Diphasiastrum complanatum]|uniref:Uncharacterized protein n=1 Tax=Diphasiastrum complanatum TaxID=34168 RepID=A0ACC2B6B8_DIPCM|nr:hypothetical protein O6H91_Y451100 [Diphasiastrum complanatum]KAJ7525312.1 hypothetical protein O6H91_17G045000 [Diphasiastrum complanatum]